MGNQKSMSLVKKPFYMIFDAGMTRLPDLNSEKPFHVEAAYDSVTARGLTAYRYNCLEGELPRWQKVDDQIQCLPL
jgi:hypothetical protein